MLALIGEFIVLAISSGITFLLGNAWGWYRSNREVERAKRALAVSKIELERERILGDIDAVVDRRLKGLDRPQEAPLPMTTPPPTRSDVCEYPYCHCAAVRQYSNTWYCDEHWREVYHSKYGVIPVRSGSSPGSWISLK